MAADQGGPHGDLYRLLGVPREASREDIAQAWRRRARAEHPDTRPRDAAAAGRFRALADAYRVLGDPARRAAYDRALGPGAEPVAGPGTAAPAEGPAPTGAGVPIAVRVVRTPEPPLRAGPVWVEPPASAGVAQAGTADVRPADAEARLAILAELAMRYLSGRRGRSW